MGEKENSLEFVVVKDMSEEKRKNSLKLINKEDIEILRTYGLLKLLEDRTFLEFVSASLMSLKAAGGKFITMELFTVELSQILDYYLKNEEKISELNNEEKKKLIMTLSLATIQSLVDRGMARLEYKGTEKIEITPASEKLEARTLKNMHRRIIKNMIDILVLAELRNHTMSGYDVIAFIHSKFGLLVSSGTVYSLLYSLERAGLIEGSWRQTRRVYGITRKGKERIEEILKANDKIKNFASQLVELSP